MPLTDSTFYGIKVVGELGLEPTPCIFATTVITLRKSRFARNLLSLALLFP